MRWLVVAFSALCTFPVGAAPLSIDDFREQFGSAELKTLPDPDPHQPVAAPDRSRRVEKLNYFWLPTPPAEIDLPANLMPTFGPTPEAPGPVVAD